jgi:hypothetical protein
MEGLSAAASGLAVGTAGAAVGNAIVKFVLNFNEAGPDMKSVLRDVNAAQTALTDVPELDVDAVRLCRRSIRNIKGIIMKHQKKGRMKRLSWAIYGEAKIQKKLAQFHRRISILGLALNARTR